MNKMPNEENKQEENETEVKVKENKTIPDENEKLDKEVELLEKRALNIENEEKLLENKEELLENKEELLQDEEDNDEDDFIEELTTLIGQSVLIVTESSQLNLLGQTFRPIFCGPIVEVGGGHLTIDPVTIKILNAPFFQFPTPLSIPLEKIAQLTPGFDCQERFPLV